MKYLKQIIIFTLIFTAFLLGCTNSQQTTEEELQDIIFRFGSSSNTKFATTYLAMDKGFYAEEGLNVKVQTVAGSTVVVKLIAAGNEEFGLASANSILTGKSKGMPLKVLSVYFQKSPSAVIFSKDSGIKSPKDLEGKKIASNPKSTIRQEFLAFAKNNGVDINKIKFIPVGSAAAEAQAFLNGDADAFVGYFHRAETILEDNSVTSFDKLLFDQYGNDIYSQAIFVHEDFLQSNPDLARKFLRATNKGIRYSLANPEEAVNSLVLHNPLLSKESELKKFLKMSEVVENQITREFGIGYQTKERWEETQKLLFNLELIDTKIDIETLFTNDFLSNNNIFIVEDPS